MLCAVILFYLLSRIEDKMERYINAVVMWTLYCFIVTEVLSLFHAVGVIPLWICWIGLDIVLFLCFVLQQKGKFAGIRRQFHIKKYIKKKEIVFGLFAFLMIFLAFKTIPYNWDSMTYHLPRIFHWLQNGTVAHYATHNDRQVSSPILGAFVNLHVYAMMNKNDIFLNMLQCSTFLANGIIVYNIARKVHCSMRYCLMASILFYTMPIAFAEALSTQVDNYAAFWMLCFTYIILDFLDMQKKIYLEKNTFGRVLMLSLCVAFGYLSKPSVGFGMLLMVVWLLILVIKRKDKISVLVPYFLVACGVLTLILAPEFLRNIETFHALSSPGTGQRQLIGSHHPKHILVNLVKNFTYNMPTIYVYNSSQIIWKYVMRFSKLLEIDINNPAISEDGREFQVRDPQNYGNSTAVNPLIMWLIIFCIILFLLYNVRKGINKIENQYFIITVISFIVFCAVLRWEPFVSRYMISYFAVLCPAIAIQLEVFFKSKKQAAFEAENKFLTVFYFLCIVEFMGLVYYHGKIALEQNENTGYFFSRNEISEDYKELAEVLNKQEYDNIGLLTGSDSYEYPLVSMLEGYEKMEHVNVDNMTSKYEDTKFIPDIIIALNYDMPKDVLVCHGYEYEVSNVFSEEVFIWRTKQ